MRFLKNLFSNGHNRLKEPNKYAGLEHLNERLLKDIGLNTEAQNSTPIESNGFGYFAIRLKNIEDPPF